MIKLYFKSGQSLRHRAFDQLGEPVYYRLRVRAHVVLDPVEHQSYKYIRIDLSNELLVFVPDGHITDFLIDYIKQKLVYKRLQIFFDLFTVDAVVDV